MIKSSVCGAVALLGAVCLPLAPVNAATVTETFNFFTSGFGATPLTDPSPVDPWTGSFTITFDPTGGLQSGALDAFSSNMPTTGPNSYGSTYDYIYNGTTLQICNTPSCLIVAGDNNTVIEFSPVTASGGLTFLETELTNELHPGFIFTTTGGNVTQTPLPAALPLFATGLGGLGLLGWRRKRKAQAVSAPSPY